MAPDCQAFCNSDRHDAKREALERIHALLSCSVRQVGVRLCAGRLRPQHCPHLLLQVLPPEPAHDQTAEAPPEGIAASPSVLCDPNVKLVSV